MNEKDIKRLNEWVDAKERNFHTERDEKGEYYIGKKDIEDLCDLLNEMKADLIGIQCHIGTGGIWFTKEDLLEARYV